MYILETTIRMPLLLNIHSFFLRNIFCNICFFTLELIKIPFKYKRHTLFFFSVSTIKHLKELKHYKLIFLIYIVSNISNKVNFGSFDGYVRIVTLKDILNDIKLCDYK